MANENLNTTDEGLNMAKSDLESEKEKFFLKESQESMKNKLVEVEMAVEIVTSHKTTLERAFDKDKVSLISDVMVIDHESFEKFVNKVVFYNLEVLLNIKKAILEKYIVDGKLVVTHVDYLDLFHFLWAMNYISTFIYNLNTISLGNQNWLVN